MAKSTIDFESLNEETQTLILRVVKEKKPLQVLQNKKPFAYLINMEGEQEEIQQKFAALEEDYLQLLVITSSAMEPQQSYHYGHNERVAILACETAEKLGCSEKEIQDIQYASLLQNIGEMIIPFYVMQKRTKLSEEEWDAIRDHPAVGARIVSKIDRMEEVAEIILAHHEKYDGTGYPEGLKGEEIPIGARIISVADAYDAMTNLRMHRDAGSHEHAIDELKKLSGTSYDPKVLEIFTELF